MADIEDGLVSFLGGFINPGNMTCHVWNEKNGKLVDTTPRSYEAIVKLLHDIDPKEPLVHEEYSEKTQQKLWPALSQVINTHRQLIVQASGEEGWNTFMREKGAAPSADSCVFNAMAFQRDKGGRIVIGKCGWKARSGHMWWEWE